MLERSEENESCWNRLVNCIDPKKDAGIGFDGFVTAATNHRRLLTSNGNLQFVFDLLKNK